MLLEILFSLKYGIFLDILVTKKKSVPQNMSRDGVCLKTMTVIRFLLATICCSVFPH